MKHPKRWRCVTITPCVAASEIDEAELAKWIGTNTAKH